MAQLIPAASYVRMSTEHQQYSPQAQRELIGRYAVEHGYQLLHEYADEGRSGLGLQNRPSLRLLLQDVVSGRSGYKAILVFDVSRWGRFQDPDRGAHYEYVCREAGAPIIYCAEQFTNDGSSISHLVKNLKRVMAAEYSRELGDKVLFAQLAGARSGHKQGGAAPFGLRRVVLNDRGEVERVLAEGERKAVQSHKVVFRPGPPEEVAWLRRMFERFSRETIGMRQLCRDMEAEGCTDSIGVAIKPARLRRILLNETYTGIYLFNRWTQRLQTKPSWNDPGLVIRTRMMEPVISPELFREASQKVGRQPRYRLSKQHIVEKLGTILSERGRLSSQIISEAADISVGVIYNHFGSLELAYRAVGWKGPPRRDAPRKRVSTEELICSLKSLLSQYGYLNRDLLIREAAATPRVYILRFGSLLQAYRAAGWNIDQAQANALAAARRRNARIAATHRHLV